MQVASRLLLTQVFTYYFPGIVANTYAYPAMVVAWSVTEIVRYFYFAMAVSRPAGPAGLAGPAGRAGRVKQAGQIEKTEKAGQSGRSGQAGQITETAKTGQAAHTEKTWTIPQTTNLGNALSRWLTWLRYNLFFVLYPVGIVSEMRIIYLTVPIVAAVAPRLEYALWAILTVYIPGKQSSSHSSSSPRRAMLCLQTC